MASREYHREWDRKNSDKRRLYKKRYRSSSKGKRKELENAKRRIAEGRSAKACRLYRLRHPDRERAIQQKYREDCRKDFLILKKQPCSDCGGRFPPECMDFDHVRGRKRGGVGRMFDYSIDVLAAELEKCELVCANCHRIRTHKARSRRRVG